PELFLEPTGEPRYQYVLGRVVVPVPSNLLRRLLLLALHCGQLLGLRAHFLQQARQLGQPGVGFGDGVVLGQVYSSLRFVPSLRSCSSSMASTRCKLSIAYALTLRTRSNCTGSSASSQVAMSFSLISAQRESMLMRVLTSLIGSRRRPRPVPTPSGAGAGPSLAAAACSASAASSAASIASSAASRSTSEARKTLC